MTRGLWRALGLTLALAVSSGCGKRGDPQPPLRVVPQQVAEFRVAQRGDRLEIGGIAPSATTAGERLPVLDLELLRAEGPGDFERLAKRSVRKLAPGEAFLDSEPLPAPGTLVRAAALATVKGRSSARTSVVSLTTWLPLAPPTALQVTLTLEGVALAWTPAPEQPAAPASPAPGRPEPPRPPVPAPSVSPAEPPAPAAEPLPQPSTAVAPTSPTPDATTTLASQPEPGPPQAAPSPGPAPESVSPEAAPSPGASPTASPSPKPKPTPPPKGFRIYRWAKGGFPGPPLNAELAPGASYLDRTVQPGEEWCYAVRYAAQVSPPVESAASNEACVSVRDIAAPAALTGLALVQGPQSLEISWIASTEADLAGYRVYRAVEPADEGEAGLIAELPKDATVFRDAELKPGLVHAYFVVAVDAAGNESAPSEILRVRP